MTSNNDFARLASQGDALGVQLALEAGADPRANNSYALRIAASNGRADCVKLLIPVSDPLAGNSYALRSAAKNGHAKCVELLIPVSDPKAKSSQALHGAAELGHADCVALLIPVSDPLANDSHALRAAAKNGQAACVAQLLPISHLNSAKQAARHAEKNGHIDVAAMIASFIEAKALSESCSKANLSQQELAPLKTRGLSL